MIGHTWLGYLQVQKAEMWLVEDKATILYYVSQSRAAAGYAGAGKQN
jgi:hypothetical protein